MIEYSIGVFPWQGIDEKWLSYVILENNLGFVYDFSEAFTKKQCKLNFAYVAGKAKLAFQVWSLFCVLF